MARPVSLSDDLHREVTVVRFLVTAFLVSACGGDSGGSVDYPPADLADDAATATSYASVSAPNVYLQGALMVTVADATIQIDMETCPAKTVAGDVTTYAGGCTTADGEEWFGTATVSGSQETGGTITYEGFGRSGTSMCDNVAYPSSVTYDGTVETANSGSTITWSVNTTAQSSGPDRSGGCAMRTLEIGIAYEGTVRQGTKDADMDGDIDDSYWNGRGQVGNSIEGTVEATTSEEAIDDQACPDEALSGTTTASAGGHAITIVYDGATDCNPASTVRWQYDGQDRGELSGVECSAGGSPRGALLVVGAVLLARRRRRR